MELAVANRAVNLRIDVFFLFQLGSIFLSLCCSEFLAVSILGFPVKLGHLVDRSQVWLRVAVAFDAPSHGKFFCLINFFHLVDPTMAAFAANTRINVCRVVEVHEFRKIVDSLPSHTAALEPTFVDRLKLRTLRVNCCESGDAFIIRRAVAVDTGCRRRDCCVSCVKDGIVAITTI